VFRETAEISYFLDVNETRKGIGKKALALLEGEGSKMGIKHILANISSRNKQSIGFHLKNGFAECGRFHNIGCKKDEYFDVVWMEKGIQ
jgi:phosphinothricin acetyltransferase